MGYDVRNHKNISIKGGFMKFYTKQHKFFCGIDLHAKTMYICILGHEERILLQRNIGTESEIFFKTISRYREDIVVYSKCSYIAYD